MARTMLRKYNSSVGHSDVQKFYDFHACDYDSWYETFYDKLYDDVTWHNINKYLPRNKKGVILDAGGGTGYCAIPFAEMGYKIWLVDVSINMLRVAKQKARARGVLKNIKFINQDISNLSNLNDNYFDFTISEGDVISYCNEYYKAISELSRVTKRKGIVVVSVLNKLYHINDLLLREEFERINKFIKNGNTYWMEDHVSTFPIHTFTLEELRKIFLNNRLRPIRIIGKTIFPRHIIDNLSKKGAINLRDRDKLLKLMIKYCDDTTLFANAEHLEFVGVKF